MELATKTETRPSRTIMWQIGLPFLLLVLLLTAPLYSQEYPIMLLTHILMYVIITVSWVMFSGPTGYISLASAAFFGVGIYAPAILGGTLPFPIVIFIGALASFCLACIVGPFTLRLRGIYFAMFTFGLVEIIMNLVQFYQTNFTKTIGLVVMSIGYTDAYYLMLVVLIVLMATVYLLRRSKYGLALQSIGQCEEAAEHLGVNTTGLKVIIFGVSAFFTGAAGVIIATSWTYIEASIAFNVNYSFIPALMAILGGMGLLYGPIVGAVVFGYLEEVLLTKLPSLYMLIFGAAMVIAILYLPDGFVGPLQKWWKRGSKARHAHTGS